MCDVESSFQRIKEIALEYGYTINYSTYYFNRKIQTGSAVDHGRKVILTMPRITVREIIGLCHELGHVIDRINVNKRRNRTYKVIRMYEEILAWIYALPFLIKFRTPFKLTIHSVYFSLLSHLKFKRRK